MEQPVLQEQPDPQATRVIPAQQEQQERQDPLAQLVLQEPMEQLVLQERMGRPALRVQLEPLEPLEPLVKPARQGPQDHPGQLGNQPIANPLRLLIGPTGLPTKLLFSRREFLEQDKSGLMV